MSAFTEAQKVERASLKIILPFLQCKGIESYELTNESEDARELQQYGDIKAFKKGRTFFIECKAEKEERYGNFFLETYSNKTPGMEKAGWMVTSKADFLYYHFLKEDLLYIIDFKKLQRWAFREYSETGLKRVEYFTEKPQNKYSQLNTTHGRCVPIEVIKKEVDFFLHRPFKRLKKLNLL